MKSEIVSFYVNNFKIGDTILTDKKGIVEGEKVFANGDTYTVMKFSKSIEGFRADIAHEFPFHVIVYKGKRGAGNIVRECVAKTLPEIGKRSFVAGDCDRMVTDKVSLGISMKHKYRELIQVTVDAKRW